MNKIVKGVVKHKELKDKRIHENIKNHCLKAKIHNCYIIRFHYN